MPKLKTNRSARKRFKVTARGKLKRRKACHSHLLTGKRADRKRELRKPTLVTKSDKRRIKRLIPYL